MKHLAYIWLCCTFDEQEELALTFTSSHKFHERSLLTWFFSQRLRKKSLMISFGHKILHLSIEGDFTLELNWKHKVYAVMWPKVSWMIKIILKKSRVTLLIPCHLKLFLKARIERCLFLKLTFTTLRCDEPFEFKTVIVHFGANFWILSSAFFINPKWMIMIRWEIRKVNKGVKVNEFIYNDFLINSQSSTRFWAFQSCSGLYVSLYFSPLQMKHM